MKSFLKTAVRCSTVALAAATLLPLAANAQAPKAFGAVPNPRQVEWFHREAQVFIHFGVNTFTGAEWGSGSEDPKVFNPTALDCGQWMRVFRSGGFTSALLVAKHHDGFCNWPSKLTTFSVASSNWRGGKGDLVKEFVDSARAYGIKPGIYLSVGDFHCERVLNMSNADYQKYYLGQHKEILQNYGKIWEIWWDGANSQLNDAATMKRYADSVRTWAPDCVIWSDAQGKSTYADARWIGNEGGSSSDPCWATEDNGFSNLGGGVLGGSVYCPAEVNSSDRGVWFWHTAQNNSVNTVNDMWNKYFQSVGHNATWLYNLPPDTRGLIYSTDSVRVDSVGCYIYGTFKAPHANLAEGATVTTKHPRGAGYEPANLVDTAEGTYYATPDDIKTDTIVFDLGSAKTFDCLMLREVIELGHRTTGWGVDYSSDNSSFTPLVSNKQSVGYKWLEKFNPVTARYVRLKITKGQACVALNTFGVYKKTYTKPPAYIPIGTVNPAVQHVAAVQTVSIPVFGHSVELPQSFAGKPFTAELLDLRGRTLAVTRVDAKQALTGTNTLSNVAHSGLYMVKCTGESGVVVRKFMTR
jgi:alpha-L-fucosidase